MPPRPPRTCSSSIRCPARGMDNCSRRTLTPRTASPRSRRWRARWGQTGGPREDEARGSDSNVGRGHRQAPGQRDALRRSVGLERRVGKPIRADPRTRPRRHRPPRGSKPARIRRPPDCRRVKPPCACCRPCSTTRHSFDGAVAKEFQGSALEPRDRALARLIAATVLRRLGELEAVLNSYLEKPLPKKKARSGRSCCLAPRSSCSSKRRRTLPSASLSIKPAVTGMRRAMTSSSTRCCAAWRARAPHAARPRRRRAQYSRVALAALDASLWRRRRRGASRKRRSPRHRSISASRMRRRHGRSGSAAKCFRRDRCGSLPADASRICPAMAKGRGGSRTPPPHCRCAAR